MGRQCGPPRSAGKLFRHKNGVDDVDNAIGLEDIGCGDGSHAAFRVGDDDVHARHGGDEGFALDGFEFGFAVAFLDHGGKLLGADVAGNYVVGEDLDEGVLVLGLDEGIDSTGGELGEGIVSWGKDGKGAGTVESVDEAGCFDGSDKGLVDRGIGRVFDDGFGGVHLGAANLGIFHLSGEADGSDGQSDCSHCCEECLLHGSSFSLCCDLLKCAPISWRSLTSTSLPEDRIGDISMDAREICCESACMQGDWMEEKDSTGLLMQ